MNRMTVLAAAGLAVALAGTGLAAADAVTSTPTYHGCVVGTSRTLEHVFTLKTPTCPSGSFAAKWNQTRAAGTGRPAGSAGAAGTGRAVHCWHARAGHGYCRRRDDKQRDRWRLCLG